MQATATFAGPAVCAKGLADEGASEGVAEDIGASFADMLGRLGAADAETAAWQWPAGELAHEEDPGAANEDEGDPEEARGTMGWVLIVLVLLLAT